MTSTTVNKAIPYAQPGDARGAGANAMRDLAVRVDELLTAQDFTGTNLDALASAALANDVWTDVLTLTYTGPARRFLVSFGANVAVSGTQPNGYMRGLLDGTTPLPELRHSDNYSHLGMAVPIHLGSGAPFTTVTLQVKANDGSGLAGGARDNAYLYSASVG